MAALEWLLIVAAMAGLAALAVVLVQDNVEDTGERISNPDPRVTSALHTASTVETAAKAAEAGDFDSWDDWERHFSQKCSLIAILYSDAEVVVVHNDFNRAAGGTTFDATAAGYAAAAADDQPPGAAQAQVRCRVR